MILAVMATAALPLMAATEVVDGITWTYTVSGGKASVGRGSSSSPAVPTSTTGAITIPSTLGGCPVTSIGEASFRGCSGLTNVTIPDGVTSIGVRAFFDCSGLTSMTIPGSVTSIGNYAFYGCSGLTSVTIPESVTSIGSSAFYGCSGLTSVTIPESVTSIGSSAFSGCSGLTSVTIPDSVTSIGNSVFCNCGGLLSISVGSGNANYKSVNGLLLSKDGKALIASVNGNVTIPDGVTSIGASVFYGCSGLTSMTIPDSVTSIGYQAFSGCSGLTSVTIGSGVTSIGNYAFSGCSGLTSVTIPDSVTSIGNSAFSGCDGLTSVTIPDSVTSIGDYAFSYCRGLMSVTIGSGVTIIGGGAFYDFNISRVDDMRVDYRCVPPANYKHSQGVIRYPREYGAQWQKVIAIYQFGGYLSAVTPKAEIISSAIRVNDSTVMDVVYKITSSKPTVKVRALAFEDGERSFVKVVRPEMFIEGTAANIGDNIEANVEHTLSWKVSADWATRLAKVKFEVLASEGELLPLELRTIPASDTYGKLEFSWTAITGSQVLDALMWLYADKDAGLTLSDGLLKGNGVDLVNGSDMGGPGHSYDYQGAAISYIYSKMGYNLLSGTELDYVNSETRLGLSPSGERQYAYKIVADGE